MPGIEALAERLSTYLGPEQVNLVRRAYFYAEQAHDGQRRRSGEPYVTHPLAVASILADMHMDHQSLMAAMLHDVIEDTGIAKEALSQQFGETVAELVDGVSKLTQMNFETKAEAQAENFQKMAMAMARDGYRARIGRGVVTIYRTTPRPGSRSRLERIVRWRYLGRYQSASLLPVCPTLYREPLRDRHRNLLARRSHKHQARWPHA